MIKVAAAVIENNGRVLVCQRPYNKNNGGMWEFPGGKAEKGESLFECIKRECKEELDIEILPVRYITTAENGEHQITFIACSITGGVLKLNEHEQYRYITKEDAAGLGLCPCDRIAADRIFGKKGYAFYGAEQTDSIVSSDALYSGLIPCSLYDMLSVAWCEDTCAPRMREGWSKEDMTRGQCSVTAFLAQDVFGGKVYGIQRNDGNFHCYNCVDGIVFDLTSEQFHGEKLIYDKTCEQSREIHFSKEEKRLRYELLKSRLKEML